MSNPAKDVVVKPSKDSPISTLPHELLWRIFLINADMEEDSIEFVEPSQTIMRSDIVQLPRAQTTTRRTSQVCQLWRHVILGSASMWGRIIDVSVFRQFQDNSWMDIVLQRSGRAPLYVKGIIAPYKLNDILTILATFWERVKYLEVTHDGPVSEEQSTLIKNLFGRPAPSLEHFIVFTVKWEYDTEIVQLFANDAPRLLKFNWNNMTGHKLDLNTTSWLSNLRILIMYGITSLNISDLVLGFSQMRSLEKLEITHCPLVFDPGLPEKTTPLHLPRLKGIVLNFGDFFMNSHLLDQFTPGPGCGVVAFDYIDDMDDPWEMFGIALRYPDIMCRAGCEVMYRYIKNYLTHQDILPTIHFKMINNSLFFCTNTLFLKDHPFFAFPGEFLFLVPDLDMEDRGPLPEEVVYLSDPMFEVFKISKGAEELYIDIYDECVPRNILYYIGHFDCLQNLTVTEASLKSLADGCQQLEPTTIIFPNLLSLAITGLDRIPDTGYEFSLYALLLVLEHRKRLGLPNLQALVLTSARSSFVSDMRILEDIAQGMKVITNFSTLDMPEARVVYVCGSGDPDMLWFEPVFVVRSVGGHPRDITNDVSEEQHT